MSAILISIFEVILVAFTIWCIFNENKLIAFEKRFFKTNRHRRMRVIKGGKSVGKYYA